MTNSPETVAKRRGRPRSFDRAAALDRAMKLFWKHGYEGTSIHELTTAMGITPPSLYAAFGDKERLFLEAVNHYRSGPGNASRAFAEARSSRDAIENMLVGSAAELTCPSHPPGCMVVLAAMNCSEASSHLHSTLADVRAEAESFFRSAIQRGVDKREVPADTDVATLAKFFMTVLQGMTIQARDGATREALLDVAKTAMRAWPAPARRLRKPAAAQSR